MKLTPTDLGEHAPLRWGVLQYRDGRKKPRLLVLFAEANERDAYLRKRVQVEKQLFPNGG